jgi:hypothetical protein
MATSGQDGERQAYARRSGEARARRARTVAAIAMIFASGTLGIIAGRTSTWLWPFDAPPAGGTAQQNTRVAGPEPARVEVGRPPPEARDLPAPTQQPIKTQEGPKESPTAPGSLHSDAPAPPPPQAEPGQKETRSAPSKTNLAGEAKAPPMPAAGERPAENREPGTANRNNVTLINPSQQHGEPSVGLPSTVVNEDGGAKSAGAAECERRYSSYRPSDGTYQPYGGGPRMRCPHLR